MTNETQRFSLSDHRKGVRVPIKDQDELKYWQREKGTVDGETSIKRQRRLWNGIDRVNKKENWTTFYLWSTLHIIVILTLFPFTRYTLPKVTEVDFLSNRWT